MQLSPWPDDLPAGIEAWRLDLNLESDPLQSWPDLTVGERAHASRFVRCADRVRFAATRATVRRLLAQRLACCPSQVPLGKGSHGKPFVDGDTLDSPLFNVAHSGSHAVIAIADTRRIGDLGVDIEWCDGDADIHAVLDIAFTPEECEAVHAAPDPRAAFYLRWVGKEAVLKAVGTGLAQDLRSVSIRRTDEGALAVDCRSGAFRHMNAMALAAPRGYAAALAWRTKEHRDE
jgi:4'-phosphopantetheinyl transferase